MAYIKGKDRQQYTMFPDCIDDYVELDSPVRLFDAFVNSLDMDSLGFVLSTPKEEGRPGYDPRDLLRIYIYGYFYSVRSSRRLEREYKCNIEVMWLTGKLTPDFRTLSDFRKDNSEAIKKLFKAFNRFYFKLQLFSRSFISIDGSKFKAVNSRDRNFTLSKPDDRIKRPDEHITLYIEELEVYERQESR
jgi:transposase